MGAIDLNADLGELDDGSLDAAVMPHISSCNIACGTHAGNPETMRRTVRLAKQHGVAIGAHPGYPDPENFGRLTMDMPTDEICALVRDQILLMNQIAEEEGASVYHVKLHGALYNDLAFDYKRSLAVSHAIANIDPELRFIVFSNSETARAAEDAGLVAIHEVFADRAYRPDGRLVPRSERGAVLHDDADCLAQAERFINSEAGLPADSICVHGDNPAAILFVSRLRDFFGGQKVAVQTAGKLEFRFAPLGERSLLAQLPPRIATSTHRKIRALQLVLDGVEGITELVPCYAELKVDYDPATISFQELRQHIATLSLGSTDLPEPRLIEVPVLYDGAGLSRVAERNGLSVDEVIRLHSDPTYLVYMLGFSPGFAYMGGLDPKLATPRLETPRVSVPAGSVGIAGHQTGIYPVASPGGWNIIGRTPLQLFDPNAEKPFLFEPGDEVRFVPDEGRALTAKAPQPVRPTVPASNERLIKVIEPGMYTMVQDHGRFGYLRYGLPRGGAMDRRAFEAANALLGNDPNSAALECTGTMPVLEFGAVCKIAVVYHDRHAVMDAGGTMSFEPIRSGYRAYIAIQGGIDVSAVMGSCSTYVPGKLGGVEGRPLKAGHVLNVGQASSLSMVDRNPMADRLEACPTLRVIPGSEADWFDCGGLNTFLTEPYAVSAKSDRAGIRLEGTPLSFRSDGQMLSSGIAMGTIQVPPSGQPIIMMADHPTTGGYPRIGNVAESDLPILAQLRPGDRIRFSEMEWPLLPLA